MSSERPADIEGRQYHIGVKKNEIARIVLLPGDPDRVKKIIKYWDEAQLISSHREYLTYTGRYKGVNVSVTSTGIGGPATAIAVEELLEVGADTFIRVGSTGAIQDNINVGDLIISTAAVRFDGTSKQYAPTEYPAVANYEIVLALIEAAELLGVKYHVGLTASTDSFYVGQGRAGYKGYLPSWSKNIINDLRSMNVLNFEMETATLFTLANIYNARAGAVCAVYAQRIKNEFVANAGEEDAIKVANEAVRILNEWDKKKTSLNKRYLYPGLLSISFNDKKIEKNI